MRMASAMRRHVHVDVSVVHSVHTSRCWNGPRLNVSRLCNIGRCRISRRARRLIGTGRCRIAISAPCHRRLTPGRETVLRHSKRRSTREERGNYSETFQGDHGDPPKRVRLHSPVPLDSDARPPVHDDLVCGKVIARPGSDFGGLRWRMTRNRETGPLTTGSADQIRMILYSSAVPVSASRHRCATIRGAVSDKPTTGLQRYILRRGRPKSEFQAFVCALGCWKADLVRSIRCRRTTNSGSFGHQPTWPLAVCLIVSRAVRRSPLALAANSKATARGSSKSATASTNQCMTFSSSSPISAAR
jgi:hypothetical protein